MTEKTDVYEELADMDEQEDPAGIGGPKTPVFLKVLRLQFTEEEAKLALQLRLSGGKLDEISERTAIKKEKLKKIFYRMADKGSVFYDPDADDPTYSIVATAAPGITETGMWSGIRFPYSVALGKAIYEYLKEWSEEKLCRLGMPLAPVWAAEKTLPEDALPAENLVEVLRGEEHWSISPCPCRISHWIADPGNHCEHMLATCLHHTRKWVSAASQTTWGTLPALRKPRRTHACSLYEKTSNSRCGGDIDASTGRSGSLSASQLLKAASLWGMMI